MFIRLATELKIDAQVLLMVMMMMSDDVQLKWKFFSVPEVDLWLVQQNLTWFIIPISVTR